MRSNAELLAEIEADGGPTPIATVDGELARVAAAMIQIESGEAALDRAVAEAREAGHSWADIGDVLNMTRQGARKRFTAA